MSATELRTKTKIELNELLLAKLQEIFQLRMQKGIAESPKTHLFKKLRKEIARVKTVLNEN